MGTIVIKSLAAKSDKYPGEVGRVELLGFTDPLPFTRDETALTIALPEKAPNALACVFKIIPQA